MGVVEAHRLCRAGEVVAQIEARLVGQQRARHDHRFRLALALDHHARGGAHHGLRRHPKDVPARYRDLGHVEGVVHLGEENQGHGVGGVHGDALCGEEGGVAAAGLGFRLAPAGTPGNGQVKAVFGEPGQSLHHALPGTLAAQQFVEVGRVVVDGDTQGEGARMAFIEGEQRIAPFHEGLGGVGEDQDAHAAAQDFPDHRRQLRVHERLAAGEADLLDGQAVVGDLVEVAAHVVEADVGQAVVVRSRFHVAVAATQIAQAAGVEPERRQPRQRHHGAALALGGDVRFAELVRGQQRAGGGHRIGFSHRSLPRKLFKAAPGKTKPKNTQRRSWQAVPLVYDGAPTLSLEVA